MLKNSSHRARRLWHWVWRGVTLAVVVAVVAYSSFYLVYQNKFYPGVTVDGVYVGGLSSDEATAQVTDRVTAYEGKVIIVRSGDAVWRVPIKSLDVKHDVARAVAAAYAVGRTGDWPRRLGDQFGALFGGGVEKTAYIYDGAALSEHLLTISDDVSTPADDATLSYAGGELLVRAGATGRRLDIGGLAQTLETRLAAADDADVAAPVYDQQPLVPTDQLRAAATQAATYLSGSIALGLGAASQREVKPETILTWIKATRTQPKTFMDTLDLADLYPAAAATDLGLDRTAIAAYVAGLAKEFDRDPKNAGLAMVDGHLAVTTPSVDGVKLDQKSAVDAILAALARADASARTAGLNLAVTRPTAREDNLDSLGIKEQLSEGSTYFPGSSTARLINVRVGASQFNGALLAPGETFSFGKILGDVTPEKGYVKGLIILGNKEVEEYGGGLCQVATTAYRAALLAGLDIVERTNHAFAISFYTWPYGVPGVDATIYYPQVDLKFKNDTPAYILIQTTMEGDRLKFDFYGTKTKTGVITGPTFLSGSNDATKSSKTIFYRDVLDLSGKVLSHDPVVTSYASSLDYTIQD